MLIEGVEELIRAVDVEVEGIFFDVAEAGEGQADAVIEVLVRAEDVEGAVSAVLPPIDDGERAAADAGAGVEEDDVAFGGFDFDAGGVAGMVGEGDGDGALDAPEGDAEAVHR